MNQQVDEVASAPSRKQIRKRIAEKLTGALAEFKQELGDKKLATRVKKASKLISRDLERISKKIQQRTKKSKPPKGTSKKKTVLKAKKVPAKVNT